MSKEKITSIYKGVSFDSSNGYRNANKRWKAQITRKGTRKNSKHLTEREAALAYDKWLLDFGEEPVNILKRK